MKHSLKVFDDSDGAVQALFEACVQDNSDTITELLQKIDFFTLNRQGLNALMLLGLNANADVCKRVIDNYVKEKGYNNRDVSIGHILGGAYAIYYSGGKEKVDSLKNSYNLELSYLFDSSLLALFAAWGAKNGVLEVTLIGIRPQFKYIAGIDNSVSSKQRELLDNILRIMEDRNITTKYQDILNLAAVFGYRELLDYMLEILENKKVTPDYNEIAQSAASNPSPNILDHIIDIMQEKNIIPSTDLFSEIFENYKAIGWKKSYLERVINLLPKIENKPEDYSRIFFYAVEYNCTDAVEILLDIDPNIECPDDEKSAIKLAVNNKHLPITNLLLSANNYTIACDFVQTTQRDLIDGLMMRKEATDGKHTTEGLEKVVYNADNVLLWLNKIAKETQTTLHAAFPEGHDIEVTTVLDVIKQNHIENVKYKCGL